jgi:hypothetical protein
MSKEAIAVVTRHYSLNDIHLLETLPHEEADSRQFHCGLDLT